MCTTIVRRACCRQCNGLDSTKCRDFRCDETCSDPAAAATSARRRRKKRSWLLSLLTFAFASGVVLFLAASSVVGFYVWKASRDLPDYERLAKYEPPVMTRIHANDGALMAEYARERRIFVPINVVPKMVIQAFLAAEDRRFYEHGGLDFTGIARAIYKNFQNWGKRRPRGCVHHHPAGGQEFPAVQQAGPGPQVQGGAARHPHRAHLPEGEDPRALSQRDLSRHGLVRHRRRGAELLRQGAGGTGARGGGLSRRPAQGAQQLPSLPQGQGSHRAAQLDPRSDGRGGLRPGRSGKGRQGQGRSRSTSARSAPRSTPPTISPRKCGAGWSRCTARMASTAAPSAPAVAAMASTAASRSGPRSIPRCRRSDAGC